MQVCPHYLAVYMLSGLEHMMVVVPIDTEIDETQYICEKHRQERAYGREIVPVWYSQFQYQNRDQDSDHAIAEGFKSGFIHSSGSRYGFEIVLLDRRRAPVDPLDFRLFPRTENIGNQTRGRKSHICFIDSMVRTLEIG